MADRKRIRDMNGTGWQKEAGGKRAVRTILFSDLRGFTSMTQRLDPAAVIAVLNRCLGLQAEQVQRFGGEIDQYVGDCAVALFEGEDQALNAVRCALEIHRAIERHNSHHAEEEAVCVGIGIVTGDVIVGYIGSQGRFDYSAVGSNVTLCSRLCSLARAWEILVSESTCRQVCSSVALQRIDEVEVKGFQEPVPFYKVIVAAE